MSITLYLCILCWPGAAAFLFFAFVWEKERRRLIALKNKLDLQGNTTTGQIDEHRVRRLGRIYFYDLGYSYEVQGTRYKRYYGVALHDFNARREGSEVTVRYWPDDPQTATLENIPSGLKRLRFSALGFIVIATFCFFIPFALLLSARP